MLRFLALCFASQMIGGGGAPLGEQGWRHGRYLLPGIITRQVKNLVKTGSFDR
jgi:hypothetical protein